ncbi:PREDICTED: collagen alpha-2(I) chain [Hipposideros armiger]|uniref:Collagen alpha-2(I) chain n=1 Tax=Hipposideros armiger TaxID=186990 RepID=A0A8B7SZB2_HIPAR|nr:PREDICTED: collagen alpha-2(I) chain [Hipposideros armiger]
MEWGDPGQRRRGTDAPSGRIIAGKGSRGAAQAPALRPPRGRRWTGAESECQTRARPSLTARPRPQPPEPELGSAATTEPAGEGGDWPRHSQSPTTEGGPYHCTTWEGAVSCGAAARARSSGRAAAGCLRAGPYHPGPRGVRARPGGRATPRLASRGRSRSGSPLPTRASPPDGGPAGAAGPPPPPPPPWSRAVAGSSPARARPAGSRRGGPTVNNRQRQELRGRGRRNTDF